MHLLEKIDAQIAIAQNSILLLTQGFLVKGKCLETAANEAFEKIARRHPAAHINSEGVKTGLAFLALHANDPRAAKVDSNLRLIFNLQGQSKKFDELLAYAREEFCPSKA